MSGSTVFRPVLILSLATLWGNLRTWRAWLLLGLAMLPSLFVIGLAADGIHGDSLISAYEGLTQLFLPLLLLVITLLLAVPLLRDEIDDQSISYLITRTIGKTRIVLGKYLGYLLTGVLVLLPPALLEYGVVAADASGATLPLNGVLASVVVMNLLGLLAFGSLFLLLGLLVRRALVVGILYAFVWEYFLDSLPGNAPDLSLSHYLLTIPTFWVSSGPLATFSTSLTMTEAIAGPLLVAGVVLVLCIVAFWFFPLNPNPDV